MTQKRKLGAEGAGGFEPTQLRKLQRALDPRRVQIREVEGRQLSHIEGWYAIAQANEIFGYAGWDRETVFLERVQETIKADGATCAYVARIRVRVRAGLQEVCREGTGCGVATARSAGAAHERAIKSAETDATKRALATFGAQFGLELYDRERALTHKPPMAVLFGADGRAIADNLSPEAFLSGLRQLVEKCTRAPDISALLLWNNGCLHALRALAPNLRNAQGKHYTDLLCHLAGRLIKRLESESFEPASPNAAPFAALSSTASDDNSVHSKANIVPQAETSIGPVSIGIGFDGVDSKVPGSGEPKNIQQSAAQIENGKNPVTPDGGVEAHSRIGEGDKIDKSALQHGVERRLRSKLHLKRVAELPCLICNRQPSHAHHIKYAQRRGMSQKVSDEFVVPLCALHHGDLHRAASERDWWEKQGQEPLAIAAGLWERFGRNLN